MSLHYIDSLLFTKRQYNRKRALSLMSLQWIQIQYLKQATDVHSEIYKLHFGFRTHCIVDNKKRIIKNK